MEGEFQAALKNAQEIGARLMTSKRGSRAHGLAMTNLETAQLWSQEDTREKNRIQNLTKGDNDADAS